MSKQNIIDTCHYLDPEGEIVSGLPKPALKLASYFALLIKDATKHEVGRSFKPSYLRASS